MTPEQLDNLIKNSRYQLTTQIDKLRNTIKKEINKQNSDFGMISIFADDAEILKNILIALVQNNLDKAKELVLSPMDTAVRELIPLDLFNYLQDEHK